MKLNDHHDVKECIHPLVSSRRRAQPIVENDTSSEEESPFHRAMQRCTFLIDKCQQSNDSNDGNSSSDCLPKSSASSSFSSTNSRLSHDMRVFKNVSQKDTANEAVFPAWSSDKVSTQSLNETPQNQSSRRQLVNGQFKTRPAKRRRLKTLVDGVPLRYVFSSINSGIEQKVLISPSQFSNKKIRRTAPSKEINPDGAFKKKALKSINSDTQVTKEDFSEAHMLTLKTPSKQLKSTTSNMQFPPKVSKKQHKEVKHQIMLSTSAKKQLSVPQTSMEQIFANAPVKRKLQIEIQKKQSQHKISKGQTKQKHSFLKITTQQKSNKLKLHSQTQGEEQKFSSECSKQEKVKLTLVSATPIKHLQSIEPTFEKLKSKSSNKQMATPACNGHMQPTAPLKDMLQNGTIGTECVKFKKQKLESGAHNVPRTPRKFTSPFKYNKTMPNGIPVKHVLFSEISKKRKLHTKTSKLDISETTKQPALASEKYLDRKKQLVTIKTPWKQMLPLQFSNKQDCSKTTKQHLLHTKVPSSKAGKKLMMRLSESTVKQVSTKISKKSICSSETAKIDVWPTKTLQKNILKTAQIHHSSSDTYETVRQEMPHKVPLSKNILQHKYCKKQDSSKNFKNQILVPVNYQEKLSETKEKPLSPETDENHVKKSERNRVSNQVKNQLLSSATIKYREIQGIPLDTVHEVSSENIKTLKNKKIVKWVSNEDLKKQVSPKSIKKQVPLLETDKKQRKPLEPVREEITPFSNIRDPMSSSSISGISKMHVSMKKTKSGKLVVKIPIEKSIPLVRSIDDALSLKTTEMGSPCCNPNCQESLTMPKQIRNRRKPQIKHLIKQVLGKQDFKSEFTNLTKDSPGSETSQNATQMKESPTNLKVPIAECTESKVKKALAKQRDSPFVHDDRHLLRKHSTSENLSYKSSQDASSVDSNDSYHMLDNQKLGISQVSPLKEICTYLSVPCGIPMTQIHIGAMEFLPVDAVPTEWKDKLEAQEHFKKCIKSKKNSLRNKSDEHIKYNIQYAIDNVIKRNSDETSTGVSHKDIPKIDNKQQKKPLQPEILFEVNECPEEANNANNIKRIMKKIISEENIEKEIFSVANYISQDKIKQRKKDSKREKTQSKQGHLPKETRPMRISSTDKVLKTQESESVRNYASEGEKAKRILIQEFCGVHSINGETESSEEKNSKSKDQQKNGKEDKMPDEFEDEVEKRGGKNKTKEKKYDSKEKAINIRVENLDVDPEGVGFRNAEMEESQINRSDGDSVYRNGNKYKGRKEDDSEKEKEKMKRKEKKQDSKKTTKKVSIENLTREKEPVWDRNKEMSKFKAEIENNQTNRLNGDLVDGNSNIYEGIKMDNIEEKKDEVKKEEKHNPNKITEEAGVNNLIRDKGLVFIMTEKNEEMFRFKTAMEDQTNKLGDDSFDGDGNKYEERKNEQVNNETKKIEKHALDGKRNRITERKQVTTHKSNQNERTNNEYFFENKDSHTISLYMDNLDKVIEEVVCNFPTQHNQSVPLFSDRMNRLKESIEAVVTDSKKFRRQIEECSAICNAIISENEESLSTSNKTDEMGKLITKDHAMENINGNKSPMKSDVTNILGRVKTDVELEDHIQREEDIDPIKSNDTEILMDYLTPEIQLTELSCLGDRGIPLPIKENVENDKGAILQSDVQKESLHVLSHLPKLARELGRRCSGLNLEKNCLSGIFDMSYGIYIESLQDINSGAKTVIQKRKKCTDIADIIIKKLKIENEFNIYSQSNTDETKVKSLDEECPLSGNDSSVSKTTKRSNVIRKANSSSNSEESQMHKTNTLSINDSSLPNNTEESDVTQKASSPINTEKIVATDETENENKTSKKKRSKVSEKFEKKRHQKPLNMSQPLKKTENPRQFLLMDDDLDMEDFQINSRGGSEHPLKLMKSRKKGVKHITRGYQTSDINKEYVRV